jgi:hypothetical protein
MKMGIFERQVILYEGKDKYIYRNCQAQLRDRKIRCKAYAVDNQLSCGCCGMNSGASACRTTYTYTIYVKENDLARAREAMSSSSGESGQGDDELASESLLAGGSDFAAVRLDD